MDTEAAAVSGPHRSDRRRGAEFKMTTNNQEEKRFDPRDTTLKFVNRPDDLDPMRKK